MAFQFAAREYIVERVNQVRFRYECEMGVFGSMLQALDEGAMLFHDPATDEWLTLAKGQPVPKDLESAFMKK